MEDKWVNPYKKFRKEQCYLLSEYITFISKFFDIEIYHHNEQFGQKVSFELLNTEIKIVFEWFNKEDYPSEIRVEWYKSWRSQDNDSINICWKEKISDKHNMSWYIVDYVNTSYVEISKEEVFNTILNFIVENEENLSIQLKRDSKLKKLLRN